MEGVDEGKGHDRPVSTFEEQLVRIGRGTPMGGLMRRYWHPVALSTDADRTPKQIRALGEDFVPFRDGEGVRGVNRDDVVAAHGTTVGSGGPVVVDCNWLQHVENIVDPMHVLVLHQSHSGPQFKGIEEVVLDRLPFQRTPNGVQYNAIRVLPQNAEYVMQGEIVFPTIRAIPNPFFTPSDEQPTQDIDALGWILPVDDTHFRIFTASRFPNTKLAIHFSGLFASVGPRRAQMTPEERRLRPGDCEAQSSQGTIALHSEENLVTSDWGIAMFRRLLPGQMDLVAQGDPPLGVSCDPNADLIRLDSVRGLRRTTSSQRAQIRFTRLSP